MLILKEGEIEHFHVIEGSTFMLPNGDWVSPAEAGWDNGTYQLVTIVEEPLTIEEQRYLYPRLTPLQFRLGLVMAGMSLDNIDTAIGAIVDPQERTVAQLHWQFAQEFERMNPFVVNLSAGLGLTPEQVDTMWFAVLGS